MIHRGLAWRTLQTSGQRVRFDFVATVINRAHHPFQDVRLEVATPAPGGIVIKRSKLQRLNWERKGSCKNALTLKLPALGIRVSRVPARRIRRERQGPAVTQMPASSPGR